MERCKIVENAQAIAFKRGLNPERVFCPREHVCTGASCIFHGGSKVDFTAFEQVNRVDRFYNRLEKGLSKF